MGRPEANGAPDGPAGRRANGAPGPPRDSQLGPRRRRILEVLEESPGLNLDEVAAAIGVQRTAAKHHLHSLVRLGAVVRCRQGRHVLHFPAGIPEIERTMFCLFRIASVRRVAEALHAHPLLRRDQLAAEVGVAPRTVRRAMRQLQRTGLLHVEGAGPQSTLHLHPRLRVLLARQAGPPLPSPEETSGQEDTS